MFLLTLLLARSGWVRIVGSLTLFTVVHGTTLVFAFGLIHGLGFRPHSAYRAWLARIPGPACWASMPASKVGKSEPLDWYGLRPWDCAFWTARIGRVRCGAPLSLGAALLGSDWLVERLT